MVTAWREGGWRARGIFSLGVCTIAFGQLALTGSTLLAILIIALGLVLKPGDEAMVSRVFWAGLLVAMYLVHPDIPILGRW
jgi:hypothetical protein